MATHSPSLPDESDQSPFFAIHIPARVAGWLLLSLIILVLVALMSWSVDDPSLSYATDKAPGNWLGMWGAIVADLGFQLFGLGALIILLPPVFWAWSLVHRHMPPRFILRIVTWIGAIALATGVLAFIPAPASWPLPTGLGGLTGTAFSWLAAFVTGHVPEGGEAMLYSAILLPSAFALFWVATGLSAREPEISEADLEDETNYRTGLTDIIVGGIAHAIMRVRTAWKRGWARSRAKADKADAEWARAMADMQNNRGLEGASPRSAPASSLTDDRREPTFGSTSTGYTSPSATGYAEPEPDFTDIDIAGDDQNVNHAEPAAPRVTAPAPPAKPGRRISREAQGSLLETEGFELPELSLLAEPQHKGLAPEHQPEKLEENARRLENVLGDFGVKGDIINVRPGPVVTLYELEPAPGIKSSRVISLADDIARSMSAISARVAVVPGRNAIGIELPNHNRETVYLREMLASSDFEKMKGKLNMCLGKTIGGEPVIADLARMPHLLVAGTTGSGKSVAINTMILSLLYKMTPEQCRLIMVDPKMLELSIYDGIPHLLTPVVTDPSKAVVALKWAVREMEDRYKKMSKIGVRNIDGFNQRVTEAAKKGKTISRTVQTGFDKDTGEAVYESEEFDLEPLPYIVVIVDEMADLMMVAGKDIEGAIQRLAQMARAAGIHLIMATQRPSVDVITGTIKANFPTRISFQVTSKIDSRTILGEQGAEQLLGMGDMLYMAGGGRIRRLHGPFCSDGEVEEVVNHLKAQGTPDYLESITEETEEDAAGEIGADGNFGGSGDELYDKAVNIVLNDRKASTSYIQRRLSVGYNKAATLIERMEQEGVISAANHAGKREILVPEQH